MDEPRSKDVLANAIDPDVLTISSFQGPNSEPELAVDGVSETRWDTGHPQRPGEWLEVSFANSGKLSGLELDTLASPNDYPRGLQIEVADHTGVMTVVHSQAGSPLVHVDFKTPLECSRIRLTQTGADPTYYWAVHELRLAGTFAPPPVTLASTIEKNFRWPYLILPLLVTLLVVVIRRRWAKGRSSASSSESPAIPRLASRILFAALAVAFVTLWATQSQYGETWDEHEHFENGAEYVDYLSGKIDRPPLYHHIFRKYYGPFSDIVATLIHSALIPNVPFISSSQAWHLHSILLYVLAAFVAFRLLYLEFGIAGGFLGTVVLLLFPRLAGEVHNNMKDFPVTMLSFLASAALYAASRRKDHVWFMISGTFAGMALATKINGILLLPVALLFGGYSLCLSKQDGISTRQRLKFYSVGCGIIFPATMLLTTILFWPWLWSDPFTKLWRTISFFSHHIWAGNVLYKGELYRAADIPRDYAPYYLLITTPSFWLPFVGISLVQFLRSPRNQPLLALSIISASVAIGVAVLGSAPIYDGVRHFMTSLPFLCLLIACGMTAIWRSPYQKLGRPIVCLAVAAGLYVNIAIHPYQTTYFNQLVGGGSGAEGKFELDYWGNSLQAAGAYVNANASTGSKVHVLLGLDRLAKLRPDLISSDDRPDFAVVLNRESLAKNPYSDQKPVFEIEADGAVLSRVYRFTK